MRFSKILYWTFWSILALFKIDFLVHIDVLNKEKYEYNSYYKNIFDLTNQMYLIKINKNKITENELSILNHSVNILERQSELFKLQVDEYDKKIDYYIIVNKNLNTIILLFSILEFVILFILKY